MSYFRNQNLKMRILIIHIKELLQVEKNPAVFRAGSEMKKLPLIKDAFLIVDQGKIVSFGKMSELSSAAWEHSGDHYHIIDATGKIVLPAFCDSHTHLVFPGSREGEFVDKIKGLSYEEIARRGGGILNSAKKLNKMPEDELFTSAMERLSEIASMGTGAVEIKSGYGLNTEDELKMLRVIKKLQQASPLTIIPTFLGAHSFPPEYRENRAGYVDLVINEMIPMVASGDLADYIDVFCDRGFFTPEDTERILMAGIKYGLTPKIHANELDYSGGVQVGVKYNALSVDHLEYTGDEEIEALLGTSTMPTILPGSAFFLNLPKAPARKMIDAGLPLAMASDFNPGSSPSGNMQLILSMACILYRLTPEEAINAVTMNSAYAMGLHETHGSIAAGKTANLIITTQVPSYLYLPYAFGSNKVETMILNGEIQDLTKRTEQYNKEI